METKGLNMKLSKIIVTGLAVLSCGCLVQSVNAIPTLTLSDGTTTIVVMDNGAGDLDATLGSVVFNGAVIDGAPYSLTQTAILTFGARGSTSFDAMANVPSVPDGGMTLTMLGIGLLAVGAAGRIYRVARV